MSASRYAAVIVAAALSVGCAKMAYVRKAPEKLVWYCVGPMPSAMHCRWVDRKVLQDALRRNQILRY